MSIKFHERKKDEKRKFINPFTKALFMYFHTMDPVKYTKINLCRGFDIPPSSVTPWFHKDVFDRMWANIRHWNKDNPEIFKAGGKNNIKCPDDLRFIWQLQQEMLGGPYCYITHEELVLKWSPPNPITRHNKIPRNGISKDRVESNIGYTYMNTKFSAHWINVKKRDLTVEQLDMISFKMKKIKRATREGRACFSSGGSVGRW